MYWTLVTHAFKLNMRERDATFRRIFYCVYDCFVMAFHSSGSHRNHINNGIERIGDIQYLWKWSKNKKFIYLLIVNRGQNLSIRTHSVGPGECERYTKNRYARIIFLSIPFVLRCCFCFCCCCRRYFSVKILNILGNKSPQKIYIAHHITSHHITSLVLIYSLSVLFFFFFIFDRLTKFIRTTYWVLMHNISKASHTQAHKHTNDRRRRAYKHTQ